MALAVILALNAAIAAGYYLRLIAAIYFKSTKRGVQADGGLAAGLAMLACLGLMFMVTLQPRGLFLAASRAGDAAAGQLPGAGTRPPVATISAAEAAR